ncbi:hypothetical protein M0Q50_10825, partial [bacterium]|nr:hypothetical protein [bacterium]
MESFEMPTHEESIDSAKELPVLPFKVEFVEKEEDAQYVRDKIERIYDLDDVLVPLEEREKSEEELSKEIEEIKELHKEREWFTSDYFRKKLLSEQVDFLIDNKSITFYNFNKEKELSEEHIEKVGNVFKEIAERFPGSLDNIRSVLLEDVQRPSLSNDSKFPLNGLAEKDRHCLMIMPRAMDINMDHRVEGASNFEGTLVHEIGHFIQDRFLEEWKKHFQWREKREGELAPGDKYPLQPDEC